MIKLKRIRLINWYAFSRVTVPIGNFTLIAGKNGNGKSVFLDAIKYALYGDTVFNKSTENKGSRTVSSYTRGLLDATAGTYIRSADNYPNVYTHIALEMEEEELERNFILGTVIDTDTGNGFRTQRYIAENKSLDDMMHTYVHNEVELPYSASELQKTYGLRMMDVKEGLSRFMQRTGLRLSEQQLAAFRRKLRSIMSYDPDAKIDRFIRESVLEEKKVDFSKLVEAKNNIDTLTANFAIIDAEIKELDEIIELFENLRRAKNTIFADDVKIEYKKFLEAMKTMEKAQRSMTVSEKQIQEDEKKLGIIDIKEKKTRIALNSARESRDSMDCARAILDAETALERAAEERDRLEKEKRRLKKFQEEIEKLMSWLEAEDVEVPQKKILQALTGNDITAVNKERCVAEFCENIKTFRDKLLKGIARTEDEIKENQNEIYNCERIIRECEVRKADYSAIPDYVALKNEINREFEKRKIKSEARFACEYVLGLKDEEWRDAIESYLGRRRYTILVEPEYYDIADDVLNSSKNRYAHLFNTKLLMNKKIRKVDDAVADFIDVKNPVAKQYFDYQLGRFHAVSLGKVRNYENAMSKEGRVSVAMDSYFLRFDRIGFYCLGQEAIELNRIKAMKKLNLLKREHELITEQLWAGKEKISYLDKELRSFDEYDYDSCSEYEKALMTYAERETELDSLKAAQKNNTEYMELAVRVDALEHEMEAIEAGRKATYGSLSDMRTMYELSNREHEQSQREYEVAKQKLSLYQEENSTVYKKATDDYDRFISNGEKGAGGILKDRSRAERNLNEAGKNLRGGQAAYNASRAGDNMLPMSDDSVADYRERKSKIWMDDREEISSELKEQTRRYEDIFKNEFVLTVLKSCEAARDDLKLINAELSRLDFKSKYAFEVRYVKDGSKYEKILEYARYLKEREAIGASENQLTMDTMTSYSEEKAEALEQDMKKIINMIVSSNDKEIIEQYADYRNYMTYEILLTNDVMAKAKLSKQSGYNSGAEV